MRYDDNNNGYDSHIPRSAEKEKKQTRAYFLNILANMCCRRRRPVVQDLFRPVSRPS